ncbi:MAG: glycosyltransferase [Mycobacterium sp.]|nr:glycosyltransferase [Mycobacterium sp.]MCB0940261.1 glycosyltransferase [Mycobacterium sp.]
MRFALACYGSRGDVEPSVAVGRELQRRGHEVRIAVQPALVEFAESAGLSAVPYGPELEEFLNEDFLRTFWARLVRNPTGSLRDLWAPIIKYWPTTSQTLLALADGADLLSTGLNYEQPAANVAEHYGIPLISLHHFPMRPNSEVVPMLPAPVVRSTGRLLEWLFWRATKKVENEQRANLGLSPATVSSPHRIAERGALEIQAYDAVCFPGLAREWARWARQRPFVGALTMELTTEADDEVESWIAAGAPPICFATGSIPVESPVATLDMIGAAGAQLGERALLCAGGTDFTGVPVPDHVKVVGPVNYTRIFAASKAIVHHGGSGTTACSLRAGVPTLILWSSADQPYWGNQLQRLKVGASRRFSKTTSESLVADLREILAPDYAVRARDLATKMSTPAESITKTADLFEDSVRGRMR